MLARTYDEVAPHYDAAMRPLDRWFLARLRASTLSHLPDNARVLEIGAFTGEFLICPTQAEGIGKLQQERA